MELAPALQAAECDLLLVLAESAQDPALAPFVGPVHLGRSLLVASATGRPRLGLFTDMEREEGERSGCSILLPGALRVPESLEAGLSGGPLWAAAAAAALDGSPPGRVALAGRVGAGAAVAVARELERRGWELVDGGEVVRRARKRKAEGERAAIRRTAQGACDALRAVARTLSAAAADGQGRLWLGGERLRAGHLRDAVAIALAPWGLEQPEGNIVTAGRDAGVPHNQGDSSRELAAGETVVVDLFPRGGLFADCTRTFCVGAAPEAVRAAHDLVVEVLHEARLSARPGLRAWELQSAACARLHAAGWPTPVHAEGTRRGYVHNLGHGVGYELHELPSFARTTAEQEDGRLAIGDVFTLEPGLYEPEEGWGIRVEDLVAMGEEGLELLTPLPYDLDPAAWGEG